MSTKDLMENFNDQNIDEIRSVIAREKINGPVVKKAYTMVQVNSPCKVEVTERSRKICANALLK